MNKANKTDIKVNKKYCSFCYNTDIITNPYYLELGDEPLSPCPKCVLVNCSCNGNSPYYCYTNNSINECSCREIRLKIERINSIYSRSGIDKKYRWSSWPIEIRMSFMNKPISTFVARDQTKNNQIIGWATYSVGFPGCFGPTGVSKKMRGQGLGTILLKWCLWDLKNQGINRCTIRYVSENTIYFYLKSVGARIGPIYWTVSKRI